MPKSKSVIIGAALVIGIAYFLNTREKQTAPTETTSDSAKPSMATTGGTLLSTSHSNAQPGQTTTAFPGKPKETLSPLEKVALERAFEARIRELASPAVAKNLIAYLRLKHSEKDLGKENTAKMAEQLIPELEKQRDEAVPAIGKILAGTNPLDDREGYGLSMMNVIGLYPPTQNSDVSQYALQSLNSAFSDKNPSDKETTAIVSAQAYLAATDVDGAHARDIVHSAIDGKISPPNGALINGLLNDRFPK